VRAVERADLALTDQLDREVAVFDPRRLERRERRAAELLRGVDKVDLDQGG